MSFSGVICFCREESSDLLVEGLFPDCEFLKVGLKKGTGSLNIWHKVHLGKAGAEWQYCKALPQRYVVSGDLGFMK